MSKSMVPVLNIQGETQGLIPVGCQMELALKVIS